MTVDDVNTQRPNILLVLADQLAASALPPYGNRVVRAPHLERLGTEGVVFERALCASPLCVPSRASLMTGLLPSRTGAIDNAGELPAGVPTFAHRLRVLGYRTVLAGKMHFIGLDQLHGFEERPMTDVYPAGFDWLPDWDLAEDERLPWYHNLSSVLRAGPVRSTLQLEYDREVVDRACETIADTARDPSRPLLLVASFTHPHDPYEAPPEQWGRYCGVEIDPPVDAEPTDDLPTGRLRAMVGAGSIPITPEQTALAGGRADDTLDGVSLAGVLGGEPAPARDVPLEYLAEGVHTPQVTVVRDAIKLIRSLGEPDLVFDVDADPGERRELGAAPASLGAAVDE